MRRGHRTHLLLRRLPRDLGADVNITTVRDVTCNGAAAASADPDAALVGRVAAARGNAVTAGKRQRGRLSSHDLRALAVVTVQEAARWKLPARQLSDH